MDITEVIFSYPPERGLQVTQASKTDGFAPCIGCFSLYFRSGKFAFQQASIEVCHGHYIFVAGDARVVQLID
jgi:hypothetical protein